MQKKGLRKCVEEAIELSRVINIEDIGFCAEVEKAFRAESLGDDRSDHYVLLYVLYNYGRVQGQRKERARRRARG